MTRRIRSGRVGGGTAETRRRAPGTAFAAALAASFAALAIGGADSLAPTGFALAQTAGTGGPVSRGNPACNRREVFLYDVVVNGSKSGTETVRDMDGSVGSFSFDYAYSAFYSRVPVTVVCEVGGHIRIDGPTNLDPHPGSAQLDRYKWSNSITRTIRHPIAGGRAFSIDGPRGVFEKQIVTCSFNVAIGGLRAQIELNGFIPGSPGGRAMLVVHSLVPADDNRIEALIRARHNAECDKGTPSHVRVFDGLAHAPAREEGIAQFYNKPTEVAGVELEPPLLNLRGIIGTRDGDSAEARKLARGESFSVASGPRTYESADAQGSVAAATSMTVTFNAVAPRGADCFSPDRGFVYYTGPGGAHSDPSTNSPIVAKPPVGGRLMFTGKTRGLSGETWFQVGKPGSPTWPQAERPATVWVPASAVSCVRPTVPLAQRPTGPPKDMPPLATVNRTVDPEFCESNYASKDVDVVSKDVDAYGLFFGWIRYVFRSSSEGEKLYPSEYERCLRGPGGTQGTGGRG